MPLTSDDRIQQNKGSSLATTSHAVSVSTGTTAGNTIVVALFRTAGSLTAPSGFTGDSVGIAGEVSFYRKPDVTAGETSWTFTTGASADVIWQVFEVSNLDLAAPLDVAASTAGTSTANGATL